MRFLKKKIELALQFAELQKASQKTSKAQENPTQIKSPQEEVPVTSFSPEMKSKKKWGAGNNVLKNYCRAFINFALSSMAQGYLVDEALPYAKFKQILSLKKKNVNCIKGLRALLLQVESDSKDIKAFKGMFQKCCEVFLKYYCVTWIYNSKVDNRLKHLGYRGKILRRVRNPKFFTYLEDFKKEVKQ